MMFQSLISSLAGREPWADPAMEHRLRLLLIDTACLGIAAMDEPLLVALQRQRRRTDPGTVRLPGMLCDLSAGAAAAVLTAAACWEERIGGDATSHGRPGLAVVPVGLGLARAHRRSLAEMLRAVALGYELSARLGRAYAVPAGEHVDGSWQMVGAAVCAAALLGGDSACQSEAASLALCQMSRSLFAAVSEGRSGRLLYAAGAVERGIALAAAACAGFQGAASPHSEEPLRSLLARRLDLDPDSPAAILDGYVKFRPGARHLHATAAACRAWLARHGPWPDPLPPDSQVILRTYPEACRYCGQADPQNRIQAQFSLPFAAATTLLAGDLDSTCLGESALADPRRRALMGRINLEPRAGEPGRWAELLLVTADGHQRRARADGIEGDHLDAPTEERLLQQRRSLVSPVLGADAAGRLLDHWLSAPLSAPVLPEP